MLKNNEDLDILKEYSNKNYSIGGNISSSDSTDYKLIKNYDIINEKTENEIKGTNSLVFSLLSKLKLNPLDEEGTLLVLSFDKIVNM